MQHIETDQFAQWRVVVIVSPAQFALRCCLNHSLFYPDNFVSCVCRVLNIDEGTEISDRKDMHHASYQSPLSSTHHLGILSPTRRHHTSL